MLATVVMIVLLLVSALSEGGEEARQIGTTTAVQGEVLLFFPPDVPTGKLATLKESIFFRERMETKELSRTKILFIDDTVLSVGANTRVTIDEHVFDPDRNMRQVTVSMGVGIVRALVGKAFGPGSKFEVRTPTAVAGVRGSYFIVSVPSVDVTEVISLERQTYVRNALPTVIGEVVVEPNRLTRVVANAPPTPPVPVPAPVRETFLATTKVIEAPPPEKVPRGEEAVTVTARIVPPRPEVKVAVEKSEAQKATVVEEIKVGIRAPEPVTAPEARPTPPPAIVATTVLTPTVPYVEPVRKDPTKDPVAIAAAAPIGTAPGAAPVATSGVKGTIEQAIQMGTLSPAVQESVGIPTSKVRLRLKFP